jgi:hypothetical protein
MISNACPVEAWSASVPAIGNGRGDSLSPRRLVASAAPEATNRVDSDPRKAGLRDTGGPVARRAQQRPSRRSTTRGALSAGEESAPRAPGAISAGEADTRVAERSLVSPCSDSPSLVTNSPIRSQTKCLLAYPEDRVVDRIRASSGPAPPPAATPAFSLRRTPGVHLRPRDRPRASSRRRGLRGRGVSRVPDRGSTARRGTIAHTCDWGGYISRSQGHPDS